ncbi:hypothetical protein H257_01522 [Aphanomyces astaci]|uniref:Uncharacterized protein n=1 Tax=Aphanomyces astaci TaxID=112090 RepID=W4H9H5_APHAT|nr:hypothetical protein H257_01522 [Aphanomyces astaci]ETV88216.1 hypothetical protein H257_01522 [Aphanomyces astaci]|eukprot:XP_009823079.1 hypothetical protein H257_01522 [Aphanomyces astaci]
MLPWFVSAHTDRIAILQVNLSRHQRLNVITANAPHMGAHHPKHTTSTTHSAPLPASSSNTTHSWRDPERTPNLIHGRELVKGKYSQSLD